MEEYQQEMALNLCEMFGCEFDVAVHCLESCGWSMDSGILICMRNDFIAVSLFFEKYYFVSIKTDCLVEVFLLMYLNQLQTVDQIH